jgi:hypothetical protein
MGKVKMKELGNICNDPRDRYNTYRKETAFDLKRIGFFLEGFSYHNTPVAFPHEPN